MEIEPCMQEFAKYEPSEIEKERFERESLDINVFNRMGFRFEFIYQRLTNSESRTRFQEVVMKEFWETFFIAEPIDFVHKQLREQLVNLSGGISSQSSGSTYSEFSAWVDSFLTSQWPHPSRKTQLKTLYFTKFHHSRLSHGSHHPAKLHTLTFWKGGMFKLHAIIHSTCPRDVVTKNSEHQQVYDEKAWEWDQGKIDSFPIKAHISEDDQRNNFKECRPPITCSFFEKVANDQVRRLKMCYTTSLLEDFEDHIATHYIVLPRPDPAPAMRTPLRFTDTEEDEKTRNDHERVHLLYYLIDMALQSGVNGNCQYGMDMIIVSEALSRLGISWHIPVKKYRVYEMVRCIAISYTSWFTLKNISEGTPWDIYLLEAINRVTVTEEMIAESLMLLGVLLRDK